MTTFALDREHLDSVRVGDRITAIDNQALTEPMLVQSPLVPVRPAASGSPLGILLHNPIDSDVEHWLYPDSHVVRSLTIERPDSPRSDVVIEPPVPAPSSAAPPAPTGPAPAVQPVIDLHAPTAPVPADIDERLRTLARAVHSGASNPTLIKRANRIADDLAPAHADLAERLRTVLTKRWEGLGNRYDKLTAIRAELAARPAFTGPAPEPQPKVTQPIRRTRFGVTLEGGGESWSTLDGRWALTYDEFSSECEESHPMRVTPALAAKVRTELAESGNYLPRAEMIYGAEAVRAVLAGKRGYLCPGGEQHPYFMWSVMGGPGNPNFDPFNGSRFQALDEAWQAVSEVAEREQPS